MKTIQKALVVRPQQGGDTSLISGDLDKLNEQLAAGWVYAASAESTDGALLIFLEKEIEV